MTILHIGYVNEKKKGEIEHSQFHLSYDIKIVSIALSTIINIYMIVHRQLAQLHH